MATTMFLKDPSAWTATEGCVCRSSQVGVVHDVSHGHIEHDPGSVAALPGLSHQDTAILAGVLTGLALFLFLLLPILCCLCPCPCSACCGKKKKAAAAGSGHRHGNLARTGSDEESFWSTGTWGGDKTDYENLYGVDMKLPRPWVDSVRGDDHFNSKLKELETGGWEGVDMTRDEIDAAAARQVGGADETMGHTAVVSYVQGQRDSGMGSGMGSGMDNGVANYSTVDRNRGNNEEVVTEYATSRRVDIQVGGMNQDEADAYYAREFGQDGDMSKDNFMKLYWSYRNKLNGSHA